MDYKAHMKIKNFNLYYGKHQVVKNINPEIPDKKNKGLHTDIMDIRKKMGLLFQKPYPLPMSIFDNAAYGLKIHGLRDKKKLRELVQYYLSMLNLWDEVKDRYAVKPGIILGDEPTAYLDPISSQLIEKKLLHRFCYPYLNTGKADRGLCGFYLSRKTN